MAKKITPYQEDWIEALKDPRESVLRLLQSMILEATDENYGNAFGGCG
jgi:hypothetical protein